MGLDTPGKKVREITPVEDRAAGSTKQKYFKNTHMGVVRWLTTFRTDVGIEHIRDYLMSKIDTTNPVEVEKVGRYLKHIEMYRRMERTVKHEGVSVTTVNGSQEFVKSHPLLNDMNKVNNAIMSIEKTFNFTSSDDNNSFTASDLI